MEDQDITARLASVGLESPPGYWEKVLKEELGVTSAPALEYLGGESYPILERFVKHAWEKKALRTLLNIEEELNAFKKQREDQKKKQKERYEQAQKLLTELKGLNSERKDRHDKNCQQVENGIRERLQISQNTWISQDKSLEELISHVSDHIDGVLKQREEISDRALLKSASSGRALQGILLSKNLKDQLEVRACPLLKVPQEVELMGAYHPQEDKIEHFYSKTQEDDFKKSVDILGYGASLSAKAPGFWGLCVETSVSASRKIEQEKKGEQHKQEIYMSTTKYSSMPLASFSFSDSQLQLSDDALKDLTNIETLATMYGTKSSKLKEGCITFFKKFGSHANRGPLHFGGIYWWKCSSKGVKHTEITTVKELQSNSVSMDVGVSHICGVGVSAGVNITDVKGKYTGRCSKSTLCETLMEVSKTGGPHEISSLAEWKSGIVASNSTWSLIDRGTTLVPVWEIVQMNHSKHFKKTSELIQALKSVWEELTGFDAKPIILNIDYNPSDVLGTVSNWNVSEDKKFLHDRLQHLIQVKEDLLKKSMNAHAWPSVYLSQPPLQQFLKSVVDHQAGSSSPDEYIKLLMQQLVERKDLNAITVMEFPHKNEIAQWLYHFHSPGQQSNAVLPLEVNDFISLGKHLEGVLEYIGEARASSSYTIFGKPDPSTQLKNKSEITAKVARIINAFRLNLQASTQMYEDLFITTLIFPFMHGTSYSPIVLRQLSETDVRYLCQQFNTHSKEFFKVRRKIPSRKQAFLFHLAVDTYLNESQIYVSPKRVYEHLLYIKNKIEGELESQIADILTMHLTVDCNWYELKLKLLPMITQEPQQMEESDHSLENVLENIEVEKPHELNPFHDTIVMTECNSKAQQLFTKLGLTNYYPQQLTLRDALCLKKDIDDIGIAKCTDPNKLYLYVLQKIMAYDFRCRTNLLCEPESTADNPPKMDELADELVDELLDEKPTEDNKTSVEIHPMDALLAIFHCADDFLRQDLFSRLVTCQLSVPLILPDPFTKKLSLPLWALRSVVREWKSTLKGSEGAHEGPLVSYKIPTISFVRLGEQEKSKSKIMNDVISDTHHVYDHFFHRDCAGGNYDQLLGDGLVEVCWYLPAGKSDDIFPDAIAFLNLHGDARKHQQQSALLSEVSLMTFALLSDKDLNDQAISTLNQLSAAPGGVILLMCGTTSNSDKLKQLYRVIPPDKRQGFKLMTRNTDQIKNEVRGRIKQGINKIWTDSVHKMKKIEDYPVVASKEKIFADESKGEFIQGWKMAKDIQDMLSKHIDPECSVKEKMLPLQGKDLWRKWAMQDKEEHRQINRGGMRIEEYSIQKQKEKEVTRKLQLRHVQRDLSSVMTSFISSLLKSNGNIRNYFLQCLKLSLNNTSRDSITLLLQQYKEKRSKLLELQTKKHPNERSINDITKEIAVLHQQIINASLGLEHLFRELGQVYEAVQECLHAKDVRQKYSCLPQVVAELLVEGYPLELMDGDAAHMPKKWVTDVLQQAVKILNNPRVFVMSVLGLQSTGKSTLMNTAFGLQFNVSAGRCTRGAFMQLLPISVELKEETKCDYVLVVDTEGLRAPELDSQQTKKHDNELATFVIGLANVTIVNIYGQTPGDMNDILQTVVHAFLRMRRVRLTPSCHFVHQNVGAISAHDKGEMGRAKFKDNLDMMTKEAAKEEQLEGQYKFFSDVIHFNSEEAVHHFPGLWSGDPPMAPVNHGYSEKALRLKSSLVQMLRTSHNKKLLVLATRMSDLWNALLHEKFVFSFKNTMEITVYNSLEAKYVQWAMDFKSQMLEWEKEAQNEMKNAKLESDIKPLRNKLLTSISTRVHTIYSGLESEMETFFEEDDQCEMLAQWREETRNRLKRLSQDLERHAEGHCKELAEVQVAHDKVRCMSIQYKEEIIKKVKELVATLDRGILLKKLQHQEMEDWLWKTFNKQWNAWIQELATNAPVYWEDIDVVLSVQTSLTSFHKANQHIVIEKLTTKSLRKWGVYLSLQLSEEHVTMRQRQDEQNYWFVEKAKQFGNYILPSGSETPQSVTVHTLSNPLNRKQLESTTVYVFERVTDYLKSIQNENFNPVFTDELLKRLKKAIKDCESDHKDLILTKEYIIDMSLVACGHAVKYFEKMIATFREQNDPIIKLKKDMKTPLYILFKNQYLQTAHEKTVACTFCDLLRVSVQNQVTNSLGSLVFNDMIQEKVPHFANKSALKAKILIDLGEQVQKSGELHDYFLYLKSPDDSLKKWIYQYTREYCTSEGQSRLVVLASGELKRLIREVGSKVDEACNEVEVHTQSEGLDVKQWFSNVCLKLTRTLEVNIFDGFRDIGGITRLKDVANFRQEVHVGLQELQSGMLNTFDQGLLIEVLDICKNKPHDLLYDQLHGCPEQCPFCKEQCDCTNDGHDVKHSVQQHRPPCLGGMKWEGTKLMVTEVCNMQVGTDRLFKNDHTKDKWENYKDFYKEHLYPRWAIPVDKSAESSKYWKWFLGKYAREVAEHFGSKAEKVLSFGWDKLKWEDVKEELRVTYKV